MLLFVVFLGFVGSIACTGTETSLERNWWKSTIIYEIFIRSFMDTNGDGIGDFKGITNKLDHLTNLQIDSIWITPFFQSPQLDTGYDISNFTDVDSQFGTMEDFEELSREAKKRGIKIFMDCVINHSSDEHIWFNKSVQRIKPYDEYYVWKDAKGFINGTPIPPNDWISNFEGSAWEWNDERKQFYLHQFGKFQPDFNLRNEQLKNELKDILRFWFDKGVTGLRMDAVAYYFEDVRLRNETLLDPSIKKEDYLWSDYNHTYSKDQWKTYEFIHEIQLFVEEVNKKLGGYERILVIEAYADLNLTMAYYGTENYTVAKFPFNFIFAVAEEYFNASSLDTQITEWIKNMPQHGVANWVAENHDRYRIGGRFVVEYINIVNILVMMLPGVACIYYGQEIGMENGPVRPDQRQSYPDGMTNRWRDPERTPMQWDDSMNAGFSSKPKPWLPVNPNYGRLNVEYQKKLEDSHYNIFKALSYLRKTPTFKFGTFNSFIISTWVYAFTRTLKKEDTFVIVINLGTEMEIVNLHAEIPNLRVYLEVLVATDNSGYKKGYLVKTKSKFPQLFVLKPMSAVVLGSGSIEEQTSEDIGEIE